MPSGNSFICTFSFFCVDVIFLYHAKSNNIAESFFSVSLHRLPFHQCHGQFYFPLRIFFAFFDPFQKDFHCFLCFFLHVLLYGGKSRCGVLCIADIVIACHADLLRHGYFFVGTEADRFQCMPSATNCSFWPSAAHSCMALCAPT